MFEMFLSWKVSYIDSKLGIASAAVYAKFSMAVYGIRLADVDDHFGNESNLSYTNRFPPTHTGDIVVHLHNQILLNLQIHGRRIKQALTKTIIWNVIYIYIYIYIYICVCIYIWLGICVLACALFYKIFL